MPRVARNQKPLTWLTLEGSLAGAEEEEPTGGSERGEGNKAAAGELVLPARAKGKIGKITHILELTEETVEVIEAAYYCKSLISRLASPRSAG